jgi:hypothetical protein
MEHLSVHPQAFIRPSPSGGTLGGVAEKTRECMLVCEAAGFDVVLVESVGVGQSETAVSAMTDMFVLLQLPNAGDDLQAIKKGVMELADLVIINKADIDPDAATRAQAQITSALRLLGLHGNPERAGWNPQVVPMSALNGSGVSTTGSQSFSGNITLGNTVTARASGTNAIITANNAINSDSAGARGLTLNASGSTGSVRVQSAVGNATALANLTLNGSAIAMNGANVTTSVVGDSKNPITRGCFTIEQR